jgi:cytochrome c oxidase subunit 2
MPPAEAGAKLVQMQGCLQCHTIDGTDSTGPTFKDLWGKTESLAGGRTVLVDENYIARSIYEPGADIVSGRQNSMPTYQGRLKPTEVTAIIEYLKSISKDGTPANSWEELRGDGQGDASGEGKSDEAETEVNAAEGAQP